MGRLVLRYPINVMAGLVPAIYALLYCG